MAADAAFQNVAEATTRAPARGDACVTDADCGDLRCLAGMCASSCDACDPSASCASTITAGPACLSRCERDADCDGERGVFCDHTWAACALPGTLAVIPPSCSVVAPPAVHGIAVAPTNGRDPSVGATEIAADTTPFGPLAPVARDAAGTRYAVGITDGAPMIAVARKGAPWGTLQPIASDECDPATGDGTCTHPRIAVARGGLVVAYAIAGGGVRVRLSRDAGATWSAPITAAPGIEPAIVSAPDGRVWVAALDGAPLGERGAAYGSADRRVVVAQSRDGGASFATARPASALDEPIPRLFAAPSLAFDARKNQLYVAYTRGSRSLPWEVVLAALHVDPHAKPPPPPSPSSRGAPAPPPPPPPWKRTRLSSHDCAFAFAPALAVDDASGTVHAVYYDTHGGGRLVHATCGATGCAERGAVDDTPFTVSLAPGNPDAIARPPALSVDGATLHIAWQQGAAIRSAASQRR
ncbi:MAG TPA: sialidase family protein [Kofleriaceae bacterium]